MNCICIKHGSPLHLVLMMFLKKKFKKSFSKFAYCLNLLIDFFGMNVCGKPSIHTLFQFFQDFCMALFFNAVIKNAFSKIYNLSCWNFAVQ